MIVLFEDVDGSARKTCSYCFRNTTPFFSTPPRSLRFARLAHCPRRTGVKTSTSPCYFSDQEISDQVIKWLIVFSHLVTSRLSHCYFNVRSNSINEYACFFKQVLTLLEIINHDKISLSEVML